MGSLECGCRGCAERHPGCHGKCERYKAFRERLDEQNARMRMEDEGRVLQIQSVMRYKTRKKGRYGR